MPIAKSYSMILFDLDGTISDPKIGFVRSFNYALVKHGYPERSDSHLEQYIGPPLDVSFASECGELSEETCWVLVNSYRERYAELGSDENALYPGMGSLLRALAADGRYRLAVCTSKREDFAQEILERHALLPFFEFVSGGDVGVPKWQQMEALILHQKVSFPALMVGDRQYDIEAAKRNNLDSVAVEWGYGSDTEFKEAGPTFIMPSPEQLAELLLKP